MPVPERLPSDAPDLFERLRKLQPAEVRVRFGIGTHGSAAVDVPAVSFTLQGRLRVEPHVDRFAVEVPGWGPDDYAWFGRRKARGRPDYWQGAVEHRPEGRPALVIYFTAPEKGLEVSVRPLPEREAKPGG
jgi:hypothetical protein